MADTQPPLPQPQLEPNGITFDQYVHYTPEKLELYNGYMGYGGQNSTGFQLAVLTNMGLMKAIGYVGALVWIEALDQHLRKQLETVDVESEVAEAMLDRLNRAMIDLLVVAEWLEE
ncbi:hypothetical protein [Scytonema sp. PCC 10023]|uniref:hypothetical protein n=1 Tax=Scytonema sp. PCC 10023 TaxID=1680591 RepID=UPI0039C6FD57